MVSVFEGEGRGSDRWCLHCLIYFVAFSLWLLTGQQRDKSKLKLWAPLAVSLALDLYSKWPELGKQASEAALEGEERSRRLLDFLYYPLRGPMMTSVTGPFIDSLEERFKDSKIAKPLIGKLLQFDF